MQHVVPKAITQVLGAQTAPVAKRRQALENYHVRARFGIARLYDTLIVDKDKQGVDNEE